MIIDTHAHYDDSAFDEDQDEILKSLKDNNVDIVVNASASMSECEETLKLCDSYSFIYGMLGVHPEEVSKLNDEKINWIKEKCIKHAIYNGGKIVAVGEIGLDYHYDEPPKEIQKKWFEAQIELAREVKLPLNIHSRDASKDTLDILKNHKAEELGGIIHCYSYSVETAKEYLNMGFSFGIGGVVTFKNAKKLVETVEYLPMESIVLETDAPYLAPTPFRGERNTSANLIYVAQKIAELKNLSVEEIINITNNNAKRIYKINAYTR